MQIDLKLPYPALPQDADEISTTGALWRYAVNKKFPDGLPRLELRLWAKIEDELDRKASPIEVTTDQWKFLRSAMEATQWPVPWARHAVVLLNAMDEIERSL
jgi:hypothetical protein